MSIRRLTLNIKPSMVFLLRFILEGYDNMFVLTTLDKKAGLVEIQYCQCMEKELATILKEIGDEIGIKDVSA